MNGVRILSLLLALASTPAGADAVRIQSAGQRATLLELFTSEGCSSCPPADRWLSSLERDPRLWRTLVPVAFHVDYWDSIGWPDRFASSAFTARQRAHAATGGLSSVYTPGFVVDGREWRGWFRHPELQLPEPSPAGVLTLDVEPGSRRVEASFVAAQPLASPLELHLAVLGFGLETDVRAGENAGRTLRHDFVVLGHSHAPMSGSSPRFTASGGLPESRVPAARRALAAWVSARGDPRPLQAAGGWLAR